MGSRVEEIGHGRAKFDGTPGSFAVVEVDGFEFDLRLLVLCP